jgi:hypothetical protein
MQVSCRTALSELTSLLLMSARHVNFIELLMEREILCSSGDFSSVAVRSDMACNRASEVARLSDHFDAFQRLFSHGCDLSVNNQAIRSLKQASK